MAKLLVSLLCFLYCYKVAFGYHRYSSSSSSSSPNAVANSLRLYPQNPLFGQIGKTIQTRPDTGLPTAISFGLTNTWAYQNLAVNIPNNGKTYILRYWDCFCAGDVLVAMENGRNIITTQRLPSNSAYSNCNAYTSGTVACSTSLSHQLADATLTPGYHNISFFVSRGWFNRGIAYAGVYSICAANNVICCTDVANCAGIST